MAGQIGRWSDMRSPQEVADRFNELAAQFHPVRDLAIIVAGIAIGILIMGVGLGLCFAGFGSGWAALAFLAPLPALCVYSKIEAYLGKRKELQEILDQFPRENTFMRSGGQLQRQIGGMPLLTTHSQFWHRYTREGGQISLLRVTRINLREELLQVRVPS